MDRLKYCNDACLFPHGPTQKFDKLTKINKFGINCGILHHEYLKMCVKKVNIFKDI